MAHDLPASKKLVYAVTAHGLGHLTRSCELANALLARMPEIELHFWTQLPRDRIASDLAGAFEYQPRIYEPGTAQRNCFELDEPATVRNYAVYLAEHAARFDAERAALRALDCDALIADVPGLAVRAAAEEGVPAIAVSNFTWDWILEPILADSPAEAAIEVFREDYRHGTHHIRLPFGPETTPFTSHESGALISRRARFEPQDVRKRLDLDVADKPVVLVCPGGWDADDWASIRPDCRDFSMLLVGDLPVEKRPGDVSLPHALPPPIRFPDLVAAADVVLAKPGYGMGSECVSHRTPLVTIDRPGFRETPLLREELNRLGPCAELSLDDFFAGRWKSALEAALGDATPWAAQPPDPARSVADQVLAALGWAA